MLVQTAWGEIRVVWIYGGAGRGEIHVTHDGTLKGHETLLEKLVTTMKGRSKSLTDQHWVVLMNKAEKANEATAIAFAEAIANLAARETSKAEKAVKSRKAS